MARGDLTCPICGALLGLPNFVPTGGDRDTAVGDHIHMVAHGNWSCANGHRFNASEAFLLTRTQ